MKKHILTIAILSVWCSLMAAPVSRDQAALVALNFYKSRCAANATEARLAYTGNGTRSGRATFYTFNIGEGFVIVAGDDRARPILAYSDESTFDGDNLPPHVAFFLGEYSREMEAVTASCTSDESILRQWNQLVHNEISHTKTGEVVVGPLLNNKWDQKQYYNSYCPTDSHGMGGHALVGCGALVMGQVMHYWRFPETGNGYHSYTCNYAAYGNGYGDYGELFADFGSTSYNYAQMPEKLVGTSSNVQKIAVAKLLYHCGVAVDMVYGVNASTSNSNNIVPAFSTYFRYPATVVYKERSYYNDTQWWNFIRGELDERAPFLYGGNGSYGGHVFVCDGYRDDDFVHLNWGWGGSYNGYFSLSAFNPGPYDFNSNHAIIIGIRGPQLPEEIAENADCGFRIYPNPTSGQLNIEWEESSTQDQQIRISDLTGRTLYCGTIARSENSHTINVSNFAKGIYLLSIENGKQKAVKKFVIN